MEWIDLLLATLADWQERLRGLDPWLQFVVVVVGAIAMALAIILLYFTLYLLFLLWPLLVEGWPWWTLPAWWAALAAVYGLKRLLKPARRPTDAA